MDISLAAEKAFCFVPKYSLDVAQDRCDQKKISLVAGAVGSLISRPKPTDIQLASIENRLQPFWVVTISATTRYDRNNEYNITTSGPEVKAVSVLGQEVALAEPAKGPAVLNLAVMEHCLEVHQASHTYDGLSGSKVDLEKYLNFPKNEITDLENFAPEDTLVIPAQIRASVVVRQVMSEVIKPVQKATVIHEERVDVEAIDLNFRPIYALEYEWVAKNKRNVIEFDALTGEISGDGKKLSNQFKGMITRDLIFDVTADAIGMIVPGGNIAVKLVKAAMDRDK
jgi:hypothetical protein